MDLQVLRQRQVVLHIVGDVAALDEGRLGGRDDEVERHMEAGGNGLGHDARVHVEQGDGPEAHHHGVVLAGLGHQRDDALQEIRQRALLRREGVHEALVDRCQE